jgi:hypothetical protein
MTLDELIEQLRDDGKRELANEVAIIKYKARMWDKYNRENRIEKDVIEQIVTSTASEFDALLNPHAHDNFITKDASGATYTGHDEEDIPGTARKGEN